MAEAEENKNDVVDESAWPIVVARCPGRDQDAFLDRFFARMRVLIARGERFGLLLDARGNDGMTREQIMKTASHLGDTGAASAQLLVVALVITQSPKHREALTMVNLHTPPPHPRRVFATEEPALKWLKQELAGESERGR